MQIEKLASSLFIRRRWFSARSVAQAVFLAFCDLFFVAFLCLGVSNGDFTTQDVLVIGAIGSLFIGPWNYYAAAFLINATSVRIDKHQLTVRHGPLPWPGNRKIPTNIIKQLYCTKEAQKVFGFELGSGGGASGSGGAMKMYVVNALLDSRRKVKLITFVMESEQARVLEQEVEAYLGIVDQEVRGEITSFE